ncbi:ferritin-like domain-containing protein [Campylobacter mucosalis]|uniref:ferritin-like domain-containing protein n=1 Tax=Campylobacter mucosalis TaxID=202 RepID=UPI00146FF4BB|nr:ferritin-like domain-containing protein [Campylobacter mucosalis]
MNLNDSLELALAIEKSGEKLYESLQNFNETFKQILAIRKNGIALLENFSDIKTNDQTILPILTPNDEFEATIFALNYEITLNKTYENLTDECENDTLRDIFFRLWATSNNEYIPALKNILQNSHKVDNAKENFINSDFLSNYQNSFNDMSLKLGDIVSGKASKEEISKLLSNPNFPFFGGLALGALATQILAKSQKDNIDE